MPCLEPLLPLLLAAAADGCFHHSLGWRGVLTERRSAVGGWDDEGSEFGGSSGSSCLLWLLMLWLLTPWLLML